MRPSIYVGHQCAICDQEKLCILVASKQRELAIGRQGINLVFIAIASDIDVYGRMNDMTVILWDHIVACAGSGSEAETSQHFAQGSSTSCTLAIVCHINDLHVTITTERATSRLTQKFVGQVVSMCGASENLIG
jgi:hypothetical protein